MKEELIGKFIDNMELTHETITELVLLLPEEQRENALSILAGLRKPTLRATCDARLYFGRCYSMHVLKSAEVTAVNYLTMMVTVKTQATINHTRYYRTEEAAAEPEGNVGGSYSQQSETHPYKGEFTETATNTFRIPIDIWNKSERVELRDYT